MNEAKTHLQLLAVIAKRIRLLRRDLQIAAFGLAAMILIWIVVYAVKPVQVFEPATKVEEVAHVE